MAAVGQMIGAGPTLIDQGELVVFAAIVLGANTVQTVTGFGCMLICVTLGAQFMPIPEVLLMAVPLTWAQSAYVAIRHRDGIDWNTLLRFVLPFMSVGLVVGIWLSTSLQGTLLRRLFGGLVLVLSVMELWFLVRGKRDRHAAGSDKRRSAPLAGLLSGAGVIHGIYVTGGPVLVYVLQRVQLAKHAFRSTLSMIWVILDAILVLGYARSGGYDQAMLQRVCVLFAVVPVGVWLGEMLYRRVDEHRFKIITFALLSAAAVGLVVR